MSISDKDYKVLPQYMNGLEELDFSELPKYLDKVKQVFNIEYILNQNINGEVIVDYYVQSNWGYRIFHSNSGSIHMALNFDGKFDADGYYGQARIVRDYVQKFKPHRVLELASGKGFNSKFLAQNCSEDISFTGIDLTPSHVQAAQEQTKNIKNLDFKQGDFHKLDFEDQTFDFIFVIESLCYATDMSKALKEIYRVLKPGGVFVVIDGYKKSKIENFDKNIQLASRLVEKTMAVPHGWVIDEWNSLASSLNFKLSEIQDISEAIMPNLIKFHVMAKGFFKIIPLSKLMVQLMPPYLVKNTIAGLFMPYTVGIGAQGYYVILLERSKD